MIYTGDGEAPQADPQADP